MVENKKCLIIILVIILLTGTVFFLSFKDKLTFDWKQTEKNGDEKKIDSEEYPRVVNIINDHFSHILEKDIEKISRDYSSEGNVYWAGEPSNGEHNGREAIETFWLSFFEKIELNSGEIGNINFSENNKEASFQIIFYEKDSPRSGGLERFVRITVDDYEKIESERWEKESDSINDLKKDVMDQKGKVISGKVESVIQEKIIILEKNGNQIELKLTRETKVENDLLKEDETEWNISDIKPEQEVDVLFDESSKEIRTLFFIK